jgi:hypothetical protein
MGDLEHVDLSKVKNELIESNLGCYNFGEKRWGHMETPRYSLEIKFKKTNS